MARITGSVDKVIPLLGKTLMNPLFGTLDTSVELSGRCDMTATLSGRTDMSVALNGDLFINEMLEGTFHGTALSGRNDFQASLSARKDLLVSLIGDFGVGFTDPWIMAKGKYRSAGRWFDTQNWKDREE